MPSAWENGLILSLLKVYNMISQIPRKTWKLEVLGNANRQRLYLPLSWDTKLPKLSPVISTAGL